MIYLVTTKNGTQRVDADGHYINEGGDLLFFHRTEPTVINGHPVAGIAHTVATFAQGYWKSSEIIDG